MPYPRKLHKFVGKVELKECSKCRLWMRLDQFSKDKNTRDKLRSQCKDCQKLYREKNKEKIAVRDKQYYKNNKEKMKKYTKKYSKENIEKVREWKKKQFRKRYHFDPIYRLKCLARGGLHRAFKRKGIRKTKATLKYLKCTWETLHHHIESQFKQGMTWKNQGSKWHVDHRIPLAAFKTEKGISICSWYLNLQPMWGKDNISKGGKYKESDKVLLVKSYITSFPEETIEDVWNL